MKITRPHKPVQRARAGGNMKRISALVALGLVALFGGSPAQAAPSTGFPAGTKTVPGLVWNFASMLKTHTVGSCPETSPTKMQPFRFPGTSRMKRSTCLHQPPWICPEVAAPYWSSDLKRHSPTKSRLETRLFSAANE